MWIVCPFPIYFIISEELYASLSQWWEYVSLSQYWEYASLRTLKRIHYMRNRTGSCGACVYCMQLFGRVGMTAPLVEDITFKFALYVAVSYYLYIQLPSISQWTWKETALRQPREDSNWFLELLVSPKNLKTCGCFRSLQFVIMTNLQTYLFVMCFCFFGSDRHIWATGQSSKP